MLHDFLMDFTLEEEGSSGAPSPEESRRTRLDNLQIGQLDIPVYINEFWTSRQRRASSLHEVSYRACFKPQLPAYFINRLTQAGDLVYDPFSGRGTTVIEAGLLGRRVMANDINPLSAILTRPRFFPPEMEELEERLAQLPLADGVRADLDLSMFYHPDTEAEIVSLRNYLEKRRQAGQEDHLDAWIRMTATNRLTGHSPGFFSVYTLPPNQAVSQGSQIKINQKRNQVPPYRDVRKIILKKTRSLLKTLTEAERRNLKHAGRQALFLSRDAAATTDIPAGSVQLVVTSPPFLDIVQYAADNWLRCWFNSLDAAVISKGITMARTVAAWSEYMLTVFKEFRRIARPGGWVCFEVGEVKRGRVRLDEVVAPIGLKAGLSVEGILINDQAFTKTSNIWGVDNNSRGTNTNRIVIFRNP